MVLLEIIIFSNPLKLYMKQDYTDLKLIKYLYKDCHLSEKYGIEQTVAHQEKVYRKMEDIKSQMGILPKVHFSPLKSTLQKILGYSRSCVEVVC